MRLSDAIATGRHLIEKPDGSTFCRCAIGMGLAAIGHDFQEEVEGRWCSNVAAFGAATREWPWLREKSPAGEYWTRVISLWFYQVEARTMTLDELIDRVRAIEPPETEELAVNVQVCTEATHVEV